MTLHDIFTEVAALALTDTDSAEFLAIVQEAELHEEFVIASRKPLPADFKRIYSI